MQYAEITKKIVLGLVCLFVLALGGLSSYRYLQTRKSLESVSSEKAANGSTTNTISGGMKSDKEFTAQNIALADKGTKIKKNNSDDVSYQLDAAEEELDMAHKQLSDEISKKAELRKTEIEFQKTYMQDPIYKKRLRNNLETYYSPLFKELNLSPDKVEKLKDLLTEFQMTVGEMNPEILTASAKEDTTRIQKRYDDLQKESNSKVIELLGNEGYEKYQAYKDQSLERSLLNGFTEALGTGEKLTEEQQKNFLDAIYKNHKTVFSGMEYDPTQRIDFPAAMTEEDVAFRITTEDNLDAAYLKTASIMLSSSQYEQFNKFLKNRRDMEDLYLQRMLQTYGKKMTNQVTVKKAE
jgi:hypothetical protein